MHYLGTTPRNSREAKKIKTSQIHFQNQKNELKKHACEGCACSVVKNNIKFQLKNN